VLLSGSGDLDPNEPAAADAWLFTTQKGEARLRGKLPSRTRLTVVDAERVTPEAVLEALHREGLRRVLTEGGPSLFAELVSRRLVDELFLTSSPALFGRFPNDARKSLTDGLDLQGVRLELGSVRRHGSHLFLRYAFPR
jgi:riboflavin biosynthesis pyrimidine reductase